LRTNMVHLLTLPELREDIDAWTTCWLMNWDAYDPVSGAYLTSTLGHRKPGRPKKYAARHGNTLVRLTAWSLVEAIDKAHQKLNT